jgi:hypothetical protein
LREVEKLHALAFNALRVQLGAQVRPMQLIGDPAGRELREYLQSLPTLASARDDCLHVLAIRELEAELGKTLKYFGASTWAPDSVKHALVRSLDDVRAEHEKRVAKAAIDKQRMGPRAASAQDSPVSRQKARAIRLREEENRRLQQEG